MSVRQHFFTVWKSEFHLSLKLEWFLYLWVTCSSKLAATVKWILGPLCLIVVSIPCCCRREFNAWMHIFRSHYTWFCMCVCFLWNQLNIKSEKCIYPVVPQLVYANWTGVYCWKGQDPEVVRLTWMNVNTWTGLAGLAFGELIWLFPVVVQSLKLI